MNDGLLDGLQHHAWATRELLAFCRGLTDEQIKAAAEGPYGSVEATFWHLIASDGSYWCRLTGETLDWDWRSGDIPGLSALSERASDVAARWETYFRVPFDAEQSVVTRRADGSTFDVRAGVVAAQALHHGSEHRAQICTVLTTIGVEPPELDVWAYRLSHGRVRERD